MKSELNKNVWRGQAAYNRLGLAVYDRLVLKGTLPFVWKGSVSRLLDLYNSQISLNHLECGVGTGYYLDNCRPLGRVVLVDLNPNSLRISARRIQRYRPITYRRNVLDPLALPEPCFDSVGINFLLHCLPGDIHSKSIVFDHVAAYLNPGGRLFGSTVLSQGGQAGVLAGPVAAMFNLTGIFSNRDDDLAGLQRELARRFPQSTVDTIGSTAIFWARK